MISIPVRKGGIMGILLHVSKIWFSEAPLALRTKQVIAAVLPRAALVSLKKRYYSSLLKHPERHMESDAAALKYLVAGGDFVIDIGAFVGFYGALLSQLVGPRGEVWSIEPMPDTFEILSHIVRNLKLGNVRALNYALSDSRGSATMEIPHWKGGGESWYDARIVSSRSSSSAVTVRKETLDSLHAGTARLPHLHQMRRRVSRAPVYSWRTIRNPALEGGAADRNGEARPRTQRARSGPRGRGLQLVCVRWDMVRSL